MNKIKLYKNKIKDYMQVQELCGKISFIKILFDICLCNILLGSTISDYFLFRFYDKTFFARRKFMTARDKRKFYLVMNDLKSKYDIHNKDSFNEKFSEYLKRDYIAIPESTCEEFSLFVKKHNTVFIKPIELGGGDGILKISYDSIKDLRELYDDICRKGSHVIEACIVQHPEMAKFHPESTNSLRITTFYDGEEVKILFAGMRCGVGDSYVDNHMAGGVIMHIDTETGIVSSLASSKGKLNILKHPDTGIYFPGFQVPHWERCVQLLNKVAREFDNVHYVGWDIAILRDDICLIEANPSGDFVTWQEPTQKGCKDETDALVKYMKNKQNLK